MDAELPLTYGIYGEEIFAETEILKETKRLMDNLLVSSVYVSGFDFVC
jgi:hypothetical protein